MNAGDAGNGGVGGETGAGRLVQVHFNGGIDGVAVNADIRHIEDDCIVDAGVGDNSGDHGTLSLLPNHQEEGGALSWVAQDSPGVLESRIHS